MHMLKLKMTNEKAVRKALQPVKSEEIGNLQV